MNYYKPKRIRWGRVIATFIRGIATLLNHWPLLLLIAFIVLPIGPHLRYEYSYRQFGSHRYLFNCKYIGSRGIVFYSEKGGCPLFAIIDRRAKQDD